MRTLNLEEKQRTGEPEVGPAKCKLPPVKHMSTRRGVRAAGDLHSLGLQSSKLRGITSVVPGFLIFKMDVRAVVRIGVGCFVLCCLVSALPPLPTSNLLFWSEEWHPCRVAGVTVDPTFSECQQKPTVITKALLRRLGDLPHPLRQSFPCISFFGDGNIPATPSH